MRGCFFFFVDVQDSQECRTDLINSVAGRIRIGNTKLIRDICSSCISEIILTPVFSGRKTERNLKFFGFSFQVYAGIVNNTQSFPSHLLLTIYITIVWKWEVIQQKNIKSSCYYKVLLLFKFPMTLFSSCEWEKVTSFALWTETNFRYILPMNVGFWVGGET